MVSSTRAKKGSCFFALEQALLDGGAPLAGITHAAQVTFNISGYAVRGFDRQVFVGYVVHREIEAEFSAPSVTWPIRSQASSAISAAISGAFSLGSSLVAGRHCRAIRAQPFLARSR